jgi:hypothetical protein
MQDQITLIEVKQAFDQWRARKRHQRENAPKDLRAQVKAIAPYYSRQQIIKTLAINSCQLDRYVQKNQSTESGVILNELSSNEFIEFSMPELPKTYPKSVSALVLTITRGDGSSWVLSEATQDVISESLRLFLRS